MYDHRKSEKEILEFWEKNSIYQKAKDKNKGKETFYFCDGPPYATGQIHPGTAWNKTIKDAVCRYQRMCGKDVRAQAGYDTHGLPIEVKVEQELKIKNKSQIEKLGHGQVRGQMQGVRDQVHRHNGEAVRALRRVDGLGQAVHHLP